LGHVQKWVILESSSIIGFAKPQIVRFWVTLRAIGVFDAVKMGELRDSPLNSEFCNIVD
jgi:hypothetical protein